jgi:hypothetical protein
MANTYDGIRRTQGRRGTPPSALVRDFSAYPFRRPTGPQWPATTFRQRSTACGQRQLANTCIAIGQNIAIGASNATTPSRNHSAANAREDASALRRLVAISQIHDGAATNNADSPWTVRHDAEANARGPTTRGPTTRGPTTRGPTVRRTAVLAIAVLGTDAREAGDAGASDTGVSDTGGFEPWHGEPWHGEKSNRRRQRSGRTGGGGNAARAESHRRRFSSGSGDDQFGKPSSTWLIR